jgi:hypothetical protein
VGDHEIFKSAYSPEGSFTYDARIDFFNLRYEIKVDGDVAAAEESGLVEAEFFLATMGFVHRGLKATVVEMSTVWNDDR